MTFIITDDSNLRFIRFVNNTLRATESAHPLLSAELPMPQTLAHLRYPLTALALVVISACGRAPEATQAPAAAKVSVAKV
ncbi:hypothetical protein ACOQPF_12055, partial [Glaesserella parasuis]|uniref:hypothetical protein n=1 Tax=Glaesserella parasuis TaxID=738 RepID=UPI003B67FDEC